MPSVCTAHEASESHSHHVAARPDPAADRDHLLQNPGHLRDPQRVLRCPLTQHTAVGRQGHCGTFVQETGESDVAAGLQQMEIETLLKMRI